MFRKISIKLRFTLITIILLSIVGFILTFSSIKSAGVLIFNGNTPLYPSKISSDFSSFPSSSINSLVLTEGSPPSIISSPIIPEEIENIQNEYTKERLKNLLIVIIFGAIASYVMAGKALEPVVSLSKEIENIDEHRLKNYIKEPETHDEVALLAKSFNELLSKLDSAFENQKLFSQNVAHELKTPLASMIVNIDVLDVGSTKPTYDELLEVIEITKRNTNRLSKMVNDVLLLNSYIDRQQFVNINFSEMISEIEIELQPFIEEKNIALSQTGNIIIKGNPDLLYRGFNNIILNATRYNNINGKITIICDENRIIISDTGIGIPKEAISKVFEPFYCVDTSRSKSLGGNGLGLSFVKIICEKHDFKIKIDSEVDRGTTVTIAV